MTYAYDSVRYPSLPQEHTHPLAVAAVAAVFGVAGPPFETARVLEIGSGDGVNLNAMALGAPRGRFIGVDLSEGAIALARAEALACGLANVEHRVADLSTIDAAFGEFDYIVAHGVLAWTPASVGAALMRVIGERLAPGGLAFVSYSALPGARMRQVVRDLALYAAREGASAEERLGLALAELKRFRAMWSDEFANEHWLKAETGRIFSSLPGHFFHDEMSESYTPRLLSDVAAAAAAHGLSYVADARPRLDLDVLMPSKELADLRAMAGDDLVRHQQLIDFRRLEAFHNSIFAKGGKADLAFEPRR